MPSLEAYRELARHRCTYEPLPTPAGSIELERCPFCGAVRPVQKPETD